MATQPPQPPEEHEPAQAPEPTVPPPEAPNPPGDIDVPSPGTPANPNG